MAMAFFMRAPFSLQTGLDHARSSGGKLTMSDARLTFCDAPEARSNDESDALAAGIARAFHCPLGTGARGVHAAEEEILFRPGMGAVAEREQGPCLAFGEAGLEARLAVALDVEARPLDRLLEA